MKIGGVYILTKRSIMRMIVAISAAFALFCASAASTDGISDHVLANRYTTTINYLLTAKDTLVASSLAYTVVPEPLYLESKALYLKARRSRGEIPKPPRQIIPQKPTTRTTSLSQRRAEARLRAKEKMIAYYNDGMTWSEAEEHVRREMWREFDSLGLACAKHNFHRLRYEM